MINNKLYTEIYCAQRNYDGECICGDTFLFKRKEMGSRTIAVLSDGMGHGVKANVLSTLTATMVVNMDTNHNSISSIAKFLLKSLPVCSNRKICYSTFSIVDINLNTNTAAIIEYDNPVCMLFKNNSPIDIKWSTTKFEGNNSNRHTVRTAVIPISDGDRIVIMSDGVTQSGLGSKQYPFGWGYNNVKSEIGNIISGNKDIPSSQLAELVVNNAVKIDQYETKDDISCGIISIRRPNNLLLCCCPPKSKENNGKLVEQIECFAGKKIICGYHLSQLVGELLNKTITKELTSPDPEVQPIWNMSGIDMITESLVTLNKTYDLIQSEANPENGNGAAYELYKYLINADNITILLGMSKSSGGVYMVDEYELRRKVIKHIVRNLEAKFSKNINFVYC